MTLAPSSSQLAYMRESVVKLLPDTCTIQEKTLVPDGAGGNAETWAAVTGGTNVACRVDPVPSQKVTEQISEREVTVVDYMITLSYDAPIATGQRIVTGGRTYEIKMLNAEHSWNVSKRARVVRID